MVLTLRQCRSVNANDVNTADELKAEIITKKSVNYRPTTDMKKSYEQIKFAKANLDINHLQNNQICERVRNSLPCRFFRRRENRKIYAETFTDKCYSKLGFYR